MIFKVLFRNVFYIIAGGFLVSFSGARLYWPSLSYSTKKLGRMSPSELNVLYRTEFDVARDLFSEHRAPSLFDRFFGSSGNYWSTRFELAIDRCVLALDRLSELRGEAHGKAFMRSCRRALKTQLDSSEAIAS